MITHPGRGEFFFWRLDQQRHASTWNSGVGAEKVGGRWNSKGIKAVYGSADPATAILEVAVHKTFPVLDSVPHVLTGARVLDPSLIHIVDGASLPNPHWLIPGTPSGSQQQFGNQLLAKYPFVMIPSSVSRYSWNILMNPALAAGQYEVVVHEAFGLDTRLNPPKG